MKKMKRWLILLMAMLCMVLLAGCGKESGGGDDDDDEESEEVSFDGTWVNEDDGITLVIEDDGESGTLTIDGEEYELSKIKVGDTLTFKADGVKYTGKPKGDSKLKLTDEEKNVNSTLEKQKKSKKKKSKEDADDDDDDKKDSKKKKGSSASLEAGTYEGSYYNSMKYHDSKDPLDFYTEHPFKIVMKDDGTGTYTKAGGYDCEITVEADGSDLKFVIDGWDEVPGKLESDRLIVYDGDPSEDYTSEYIFALPGGDPLDLYPDAVKNAQPGGDDPDPKPANGGGDDDISTVDWETVTTEGEVADAGFQSAGKDIYGDYEFVEMVMDEYSYTAEDLQGAITFTLTLNKDGTAILGEDGDLMEMEFSYDASSGIGLMWEKGEESDAVNFAAVEEDGHQYIVMVEGDEYIIFGR